MSWGNYIKRNSTGKKYTADCQLVTAVNAYYYHLGDTIEQGSETYNELAELARCCYGSCIQIEKVWEELGIWEDQRFSSYWDMRDHLTEDCYMELNVWHKFFGYHSVAIVDYIEKAECVRVINLKHVTSTDGWIFLEDLKPHIIDNPDKSNEPRWVARTFKSTHK